MDVDYARPSGGWCTLHEQLITRNRLDTSFSEVVVAHAAGVKTRLQLGARADGLARELAVAQEAVVIARRRADRAEEGAARGAELPAVEKKAAALQEELGLAYKAVADSTRQLLSVRDALSDAQARAALQDAALETTRCSLDAERLRCAELTEALERQRAATVEASSELGARGAERDAAVSRARMLEAENATLVTRWLQHKETQAVSVNDANSVVEQMRRAAGSMRAAFEAPLPTSLASALASFSFGGLTAAATKMDTGAAAEGPSFAERLTTLARRPLPSAARHTLRGDAGGSLALAFAPSGAFLASAGGDRGAPVALWEPVSGSKVNTLVGGGTVGAALDAAFAPDERTLLVAGSDCALRLWDVATSRVRHALTGHLEKVVACAFAYSDATRAASASHDRALKLWDLGKGFCIQSIMCASSCAALALSRDGQVLVSAHFDGAVRLWDLRTGELARELSGVHNQPILSAALAPSGDEILTAGRDHVVRLTDLRSGAPGKPFTTAGYRSSGAPHTCVLSPDGQHAAAGTTDGALYIWSTASGALLNVLKGPPHPVCALAWSPVGAPLAASYKNGAIICWE